MIGWGRGSREQCGNMESLQRDCLTRVKAVDAFGLPTKQQNMFLYGLSTYHRP